MQNALSRHIRGMELRKPLTKAQRHRGKKMKERENVLFFLFSLTLPSPSSVP
jgi:hypothetical protein